MLVDPIDKTNISTEVMLDHEDSLFICDPNLVALLFQQYWEFIGNVNPKQLMWAWLLFSGQYYLKSKDIENSVLLKTMLSETEAC